MPPTRGWTFGADPACDVVLIQDYVSSRHCRLSQTPEGFVLEDLGSTNGTWVNGARISGPQPVTARDRITLGQLTPMPWPADAVAAAPSPPPPAPAPGAPSVAAPPQREITIGRGPENEVVLDYPTVSTRHARILVEGTSFTLEDLGSTNGTFLGGLDRRIVRATLSAGDTVYFGTQPIPAARLLATVLPASAATMAINPRQLAALVTAGAVKPQAPGRVPPPPPPRPAQPRPAARAAASMTAGRGKQNALLIAGGSIGLMLVLFVSFLSGRNATRPTDGSAPAAVRPPIENSGSTDTGRGSSRPVDPPHTDRGDGSSTAHGNHGAAAPSASEEVPVALFAVLVERSVPGQGKVLGQLGSATAVGDHTLISSGAVATEIRRHLAESWDVLVYNPALKREYRVTQATPHPEYQRATDEFNSANREFRAAYDRLEEARKADEGDQGKDKQKEGEKPADPKKKGKSQPLSSKDAEALVKKLHKLEDRMLEAVERQVHFDAGAIEVTGPVPVKLQPAEGSVELGVKVHLVGYPQNLDEKEVRRDELRPPAEFGGRFRQRAALAPSAGVQTQNVLLFSSAPPDHVNLSGSVVLNAENRPVAVYSRPTLPLKAGEKPSRESADIVPVAVWSTLLGK